MTWFGSGHYRKLLDIYQNHKDKILIFDVETTGVSATDKILQITLLNGYGNILFSSYIKPGNRKHWPGAKRVNHISYDMVKDSPTFRKCRLEIQKYFACVKLIVGYNLPFDLRFVQTNGIVIPPTAEKFDVMMEYGHLKSIDNDGFFKRYKLTACAENYGVSYKAHNAESDAFATFHCFDALMNDDTYIHGVNKYRKQKEKKSKKIVQPEVYLNSNKSMAVKQKLRIILKRLAYLCVSLVLFFSIRDRMEWVQQPQLIPCIERIAAIINIYVIIRILFPHGHFFIPKILWFVGIGIDLLYHFGFIKFEPLSTGVYFVDVLVDCQFTMMDFAYFTVAFIILSLYQKIARRFYFL